jgi:hypothetical protein
VTGILASSGHGADGGMAFGMFFGIALKHPAGSVASWTALPGTVCRGTVCGVSILSEVAFFGTTLSEIIPSYFAEAGIILSDIFFVVFNKHFPDMLFDILDAVSKVCILCIRHIDHGTAYERHSDALLERLVPERVTRATPAGNAPAVTEWTNVA